MNSPRPRDPSWQTQGFATKLQGGLLIQAFECSSKGTEPKIRSPFVARVSWRRTDDSLELFKKALPNPSSLQLKDDRRGGLLDRQGPVDIHGSQLQVEFTVVMTEDGAHNATRRPTVRNASTNVSLPKLDIKSRASIIE